MKCSSVRPCAILPTSSRSPCMSSLNYIFPLNMKGVVDGKVWDWGSSPHSARQTQLPAGQASSVSSCSCCLYTSLSHVHADGALREMAPADSASGHAKHHTKHDKNGTERWEMRHQEIDRVGKKYLEVLNSRIPRLLRKHQLYLITFRDITR